MSTELNFTGKELSGYSADKITSILTAMELKTTGKKRLRIRRILAKQRRIIKRGNTPRKKRGKMNIDYLRLRDLHNDVNQRIPAQRETWAAHPRRYDWPGEDTYDEEKYRAYVNKIRESGELPNSDWTVVRLKKYAKRLLLTRYSKQNKAKLLIAINEILDFY